MGAIFRPHVSDDQKSDRSARDRARHRQKIRDSIRDNIADILAEESIIGRERDKIIKVPIRSIKEYRFIYGENTPGTAQGNGESKPGDVVGRGDPGQPDASGQAGKDRGRPPLFLFQGLPAQGHVPRTADPGIAKDMWMTVYELGADALHHVSDTELALFVGYLSMKDYVHEQIAQFLAELSAITDINGFQDFIALFQKRWFERDMGLLSVPGATAVARVYGLSSFTTPPVPWLLCRNAPPRSNQSPCRNNPG